jgi:hypothetical protein
MTNNAAEGLGVTPDDFNRVEAKVDQCLEAIGRLILLDERQNVQGQRIRDIEQRASALEASLLTMEREFVKEMAGVKQEAAKELAKTQQKLDQWINYGIGAWFIATGAFTVWRSFHG